MLLALIVNNYGEMYDGVGNYAQVMVDNFPENMSTVVFTTKCATKQSKIKRILNFGMTKKILEAEDYIRGNPVDAVLIEYPFTEFNPCILYALRRLKRVLPQECPVVVSLHEYERLNPLARRIANSLCRIADQVLVTTQDALTSVKQRNLKVSIRNIPTNVFDADVMRETIERNKDHYVFFGTVNKMKAVPELLNAWKRFNVDGSKTLYILTATDMGDVEQRFPGVRYIKGADEEEILRIMRSCTFNVVPIRPCVDEKNTTFFTGCLAGCVSLGCMCKSFADLPFVRHLDNYNEDTLFAALSDTLKCTPEGIAELSTAAVAFGLKREPRTVAAELGETIKSACQLLIRTNE